MRPINGVFENERLAAHPHVLFLASADLVHASPEELQAVAVSGTSSRCCASNAKSGVGAQLPGAVLRAPLMQHFSSLYAIAPYSSPPPHPPADHPLQRQLFLPAVTPTPCVAVPSCPTARPRARTSTPCRPPIIATASVRTRCAARALLHLSIHHQSTVIASTRALDALCRNRRLSVPHGDQGRSTFCNGVKRCSMMTGAGLAFIGWTPAILARPIQRRETTITSFWREWVVERLPGDGLTTI